MSAPNLDAMERDELMMFWNRSDKHPVDTARGLFPAQYGGYVTATKDLGHYAANKAAAMLCRSTGDINSALMYEGICERIYDSLPNFAQW